MKSHTPGALLRGYVLVKKGCFGEGVLWIRPSPCPLPARGEGVFRCGGFAPTPPEKVSKTLFRQSDTPEALLRGIS